MATNDDKEKLIAAQERLADFEKIIAETESGIIGWAQEIPLKDRLLDLSSTGGDLNSLKPELSQLGVIARLSLILDLLGGSAVFGIPFYHYESSGKEVKKSKSELRRFDEECTSEQIEKFYQGCVFEGRLSEVLHTVIKLMRSPEKLPYAAMGGFAIPGPNQDSPTCYEFEFALTNRVYVGGFNEMKGRGEHEQRGLYFTDRAKTLAEAMQAMQGNQFAAIAGKLISTISPDLDNGKVLLSECFLGKFDLLATKKEIKELELRIAKSEVETGHQDRLARLASSDDLGRLFD